MVLSLERSDSLTDLRRTQRRVAALLLSDKHAEIQKIPLRKRTLPLSCCYVCSRIDPNGIFRNPNDYLYKKGFFHTCDPLQKAADAALETKEVTKQDLDVDSFTKNTRNRTETICVTIRHGSRSTSEPSPLKRQGTYDSEISKYGKEQRSSRNSFVKREVSDSSAEKLSLPPIIRDMGSRVSEKTYVKAPSVALTVLSKQSPFLSETLPTGSETDVLSGGERITIIPTGLDKASAISGLSTFTEGTTPSKSTNDLDSKFASEEEKSLRSRHSFTTLPSKQTVTTQPTQRSVTSLADKRSLTTLHSKQSLTTYSRKTVSTSEPSAVIDTWLYHSDEFRNGYRPEPLVREMVMIDESREEVRRHNKGHQRERHHGQSIDDDATHSERSLEKEQYKLELGSLPDSYSSKNISDDSSIVFSEQSTVTRNPSEGLGLCRCATEHRDINYSKNVCEVCRKAYQSENGMYKDKQSHTRTDSDTRVSSSTRCLSTRQQMLQHGETRLNTRSETSTDRDHPTRTYIRSKTSFDENDKVRMSGRSKTTIDEDYMTRMNIQSKPSTDKDYKTRMNIRSKAVTDEDYMDLDSILYEDDGRYWSSGDESPPMSPYRYKHAHPYPLVNPDIHKTVYIKALQAARARGIKKLEDFDNIIRRPNVFSYIPLLSEKNQKDPKYFALRPDNSTKPKKGQLMKHIFGDIRPDDFYEGPITEKETEVVIEYSSNDSSTDKITSESQVTAISRKP